MIRRLTALAVAAVCAGALVACTAADSAAPGQSPVASCLPAASATPGPTGSAVGATGSASAPTGSASGPLPAVTLPCLDGGAKVDLAALGRPAVINLWAAWCLPCRDELPALQKFAAAGTVTVIGVDTQDTTGGARDAIGEFGLTYPMLSDPSRVLLLGVNRTTLPATLFVDADGGLRYVYNEGTPLTEQRLAELTATYLGVR